MIITDDGRAVINDSGVFVDIAGIAKVLNVDEVKVRDVLADYDADWLTNEFANRVRGVIVGEVAHELGLTSGPATQGTTSE